MKAIILTYAPLLASEREILKHTKIFKLALNQHARDLKPDARIITDYVLQNIRRTCTEKIISVRDRLRYYLPDVEYPDIEFNGSTIIAAVKYLISKHYDEILIAADNTVNSVQFRSEVKAEMDKIKSDIRIYQYSKGNFNLPVKSISDFVSESPETNN